MLRPCFNTTEEPDRMNRINGMRKIFVYTLPGALLAAGIAICLHHPTADNQPTGKVVYSPSGFGGYVTPVPPVKKAPGPVPTGAPVPTVETAQALYDAGNYRQAEEQAQQVINATYRSPDLPHLEQAAQA